VIREGRSRQLSMLVNQFPLAMALRGASIGISGCGARQWRCARQESNLQAGGERPTLIPSATRPKSQRNVIIARSAPDVCTLSDLI
jgi:hypothetical protein